MQKIIVSIIIVHYKDKKRLFNCITSIKKNKPKTSFELIIIDNDETQTIKKELQSEFGWVRYAKSSGNIGYGAGNNLGVRLAKGKYVFILNPDTEVLPSSIDKLTNYLEKNKQVGMAAPTLVNSKGKIISQIGYGELTPLSGIIAFSFLNKKYPNNIVSRKYWQKDITRIKSSEVDVVPGSAFLMRKNLFNKIKGFDENIFLYFEENDLCKRMKEAGFVAYLVPDAQIIHYWKPGAPNTRKAKKIFAQSRFYYYKKHYGVCKALVVEIFLRFSKRVVLMLSIVVIGVILRMCKLGG